VLKLRQAAGFRSVRVRAKGRGCQSENENESEGVNLDVGSEPRRDVIIVATSNACRTITPKG
jgi:hypothetical protein